MDILFAITGTILVTLGGVIFILKGVFDTLTLNANEAYQRIGEKKFLGIPYGKWIQGKIRKFVEEFIAEIFKDEPPEKKEKVKQHFNMDFQQRRREDRKKLNQ